MVQILLQSVLLISLLRPSLSTSDISTSLKQICTRIKHELSRESGVFFPGSTTYVNGISHYTTSSSQNSTCVVEPGTTADVGTILRIVGSTRTPFAVKGGGHATNLHFSSTTGVHISMARFSTISYDSKSQVAVVGAGLVWDDVYAALERFNVSVVGGRVSGIGVAGFTLGGGYSWKTNQYGLGIDNVISYELVRPDGHVVSVTATSHPDLFFALRGGGNNFGIVTRFTFKTFPQTLVWGGVILTVEPNLKAGTAALVKFASQVKDPKASIISGFDFAQGQLIGSHILFYDAPTPPSGIFEDFLALPNIQSDVGTRTLLNLVQASPLQPGFRGLYNVLPMINTTADILDAISNEVLSTGTQFANKTPVLIGIAMEPFLPNILQHSKIPSAYPPDRSVTILPYNLVCGWVDPQFDSEYQGMARKTAARIRDIAVVQGQTKLANASHYPNYALFGTSLKDIYGGNVRRLEEIKREVDHSNIMGLAGGFKL